MKEYPHAYSPSGAAAHPPDYFIKQQSYKFLKELGLHYRIVITKKPTLLLSVWSIYGELLILLIWSCPILTICFVGSLPKESRQLRLLGGDITSGAESRECICGLDESIISVKLIVMWEHLVIERTGNDWAHTLSHTSRKESR